MQDSLTSSHKAKQERNNDDRREYGFAHFVATSKACLKIVQAYTVTCAAPTMET